MCTVSVSYSPSTVWFGCCVFKKQTTQPTAFYTDEALKIVGHERNPGYAHAYLLYNLRLQQYAELLDKGRSIKDSVLQNVFPPSRVQQALAVIFGGY